MFFRSFLATAALFFVISAALVPLAVHAGTCDPTSERALQEAKKLQDQIRAAQIAISHGETDYYIATSLAGGSLLVFGIETAGLGREVRNRQRFVTLLRERSVVGVSAILMTLAASYYSYAANDALVISKAELEDLKKNLERHCE